jgi:3-oxoacyl-[acyl-carrier protein] reductase
MNKTLEGKVAIITGGSRGIGRATATLLAQHGAKVLLWDVLEKEGEELVGQLRKQGAGAAFYKVDVAKREQVDEAVRQGVESFGRIDILINNAGITRDASLLKMKPDDWQKVIDINLTGVFNCTQSVAGLMKEQGYGRIVSASSIVGLYGNFGQTNYVATKAGVIGMTKTWAKELGRYGITVNCIAPGFILTEMTEAIPKEYRKPLIEKIPVKRAGTPEDIARGYLFLVQEESSFINGICLSIDGGAVA